MIKIAWLFAIWEIVKVFWGGEVMLSDIKKEAGLACFVLFFDLPYTAWAAWLLFKDPNPAIALWGLTAIGMLVMAKWRPWYDLYRRIDGIFCAVILVLVAVGRA